MRQFSFSLANQEDDAQLRALIRATPMEGKISVAFQCEPSYFYAARTEGKFNQTIVAREFENGNVIGMGSRSVKPAFVNGEVTQLGYLSSLRIHEDYRHHTLLSRGYHTLKNLHSDNKVKAYVSTIIYDNTQAISLLTAGRDGLPKYHDFGVYNTYVVKLRRSIKAKSKGADIVRGGEQNLNEIVKCLQRNGRDKQFYPYYEGRDFEPGSEFLRDFKKEDFYVALKDSRIVGVLGKWDQRSFKQVVICGYDRKISGIRPVYNYLADLVNWPALPSPQSALASFCVSFIAVDDNDPEIFSSLLNTVYNDHVRSEYEYMVVGLYDQDPLASVAERYPHIKYKSRVFVVCWEDGEEWFHALDTRIPYLEIATL